MGNYSLYGNWINDTADFKAPLLELHDGCVVDAGAFWENEDRWVSRIRHVLLQSAQKSKERENESKAQINFCNQITLMQLLIDLWPRLSRTKCVATLAPELFAELPESLHGAAQSKN